MKKQLDIFFCFNPKDVAFGGWEGERPFKLDLPDCYLVVAIFFKESLARYEKPRIGNKAHALLAYR